MSNRMTNYNASLVGFGVIFLFLVSLIYLIHKTHDALEVTRERLRTSEDRLQILTTQYDSLSEYKNRLEKALLHIKDEKSETFQKDRTSLQELDRLRDLCSKKIETLQEDLRACQKKEVGDSLGAELDLLSHKFSSLSSALTNRHIKAYVPRPPGESGAVKSGFIFNQKSVDRENQRSNESGGVQELISPKTLQFVQPPSSGDPNEDPAGNVFI